MGVVNYKGVPPVMGGWGSVVASVLHIPQVISLADVTKDQIQNPLKNRPVLHQDHQAPEVLFA